MADTFYVSQNYNEAVKHFSKAISMDPNRVKGYWYRGDSFFAMKNYPDAISDYTTAIELEPGNYRFYKKRGDCYYNTEQYALSEKDYTKCIELNPKDSIFWLYRGDCYRKLNRSDSACSDYKRADELGNTGARKNARSAECLWVLTGEKPSGRGMGSIRIDPFTGAVFVLKGISFEDFNIMTKKENEYVTGNEIGIGEEFAVKLTEPINFVKDGKGDVFLGAGFSLHDSSGNELGRVDDLYKEAMGLPAMNFSSMSISLSMSQPLVQGTGYSVRMWFYDKKGDGKITIDMPVYLTSKTSKAGNILKTASVLGNGINTSAVNAAVKSITFTQKNSPDKTIPGQLKNNTVYAVFLNDTSNLKKDLKWIAQFIDDRGVVASRQSGDAGSDGSSVMLNISTEGLKPGDYYIWIKVRENAASNNIGIVIPAAVK